MRIKSLQPLACLAFFYFFACRDSDSTNSSSRIDSSTVSGSKFADHIRTTDFQTPEQERESLHLPPGFEITLFASEPDISKPINIEFDAAGRLWVSQSSEYPMAAAPGAGHDRITILEDTDGDGKADKFTHFADDLNIPIGLIPVKDGAIGYNIPNVYHFIDKNGDGKYDDKKMLLGPFGHQDTHGMVSNFIRGFDGWINSCHGFTNTSTVTGSDGDSITMMSGNTFRFKEDGSRVEQTSFGRVNPFGFTYDEWGYLYSVDCHSKPIYQMINGAEYPHFGKRSPAIGFAPEMMSYELGSTALSGLVNYIGDGFPKEYQNAFFNGDVVTCRINRNSIHWEGSSPVSEKEPDFLVSSDPWFRPVNIKLGPDGAMYVADFYNKIIGHYEVDLDNPGRDRKSGRIWKITYVGDKNKTPQKIKNWATASLPELISNLNHPQLSLRMIIANQVYDRFGQKAVAPLRQAIASKQDSKAFIQTLWLLYRLNALPDDVLDKAITNTDPMVQTHALRVIAETKKLSDKQKQLVLQELNNSNPHVKRAATEVFSTFPEQGDVKLLLASYKNSDEKDNHLTYTTLISLRQNLRNEKVMHKVVTSKWNDSDLALLIKTMPDVPSQEGASFTLDYIRKHNLPQEQMVRSLEYVGRYVPPGRLDQAIAMIKSQVGDNSKKQYEIYQTIRKGMAQQGVPVSKTFKEWGSSLAKTFLQEVRGKDGGWTHINNEKDWTGLNPWNVVRQYSIGGSPPMDFIWSLHDFSPTGILHSSDFKMPSKMSLSVYDNDLQYQEPNLGVSRNVVRIRLKSNNQIIADFRHKTKQKVTEKDFIHPVTFDLSQFQNQLAYIEVVDSSRSPGGVGIGNFSPAVVSLPLKGPGEISAQQIRAAEIITDLKLPSMEAEMRPILQNNKGDIEARAAAAMALMAVAPKQNTALVSEAFNSITETQEMREKLVSALGLNPAHEVLTTLQKGLTGSPQFLQLSMVKELIKTQKGIALLIYAAKEKNVNGDLLNDVSIRERLLANSSTTQKADLEKIMQTESGVDERKKLIADRLKSFDSTSVTATNGRQVFSQNCSMCHQIKGEGGMIGPQLDGIGNWGQKALTEKILNPNGNIAQAFRVF
ncbi:MAG: PVC-type heme-binding CxxCH protein, partial [Ginsengibacter sp.]